MLDFLSSGLIMTALKAEGTEPIESDFLIISRMSITSQEIVVHKVCFKQEWVILPLMVFVFFTLAVGEKRGWARGICSSGQKENTCGCRSRGHNHSSIFLHPCQ